MSSYYGLEKLVNISDADFTSISEMLHYIKEKRYYQRNAAVALGNYGEGALALEKAMIDPDEIVRGHAAWALGRLNTKFSRRILESKLKSETNEYVLSEIKVALI
jgi:epoxyqueuosine reductase